MAVGDVYVVTDQMYINIFDPIVNVFHVRDTDGAGSPTDLLTKWISHGWFSQLQSLQSNELTASLVTVRKLIPYGSGSQFENYAPGTVGGVSLSSAPPNVAGIVSWYDGLIGRSNRGRTFFAGIPASYLDKGLITTTPLANLQTVITSFYNYWKTAGTSTHYELGVWSRKVAGSPPSYNPAAFQPIIEFTLRSWTRSQRRRDYGISIGRSA